MSDRVVPGRVPRLSPGVTDVLLAVSTVLVAVANVAVAAERDARPPDVLGYGLAAALGAILLVRRRWPRAVLVGSAAILQAYLAFGYPRSAWRCSRWRSTRWRSEGASAGA